MKKINAWVRKETGIECTNSIRVKEWIRSQHYKMAFPCYAFPDGKYLGGQPPKGLTKPDHILIMFNVPERVTLQVPVESVNVWHRFLKHEVRADFVPMVRMMETNSSFNHAPQIEHEKIKEMVAAMNTV